MLIPCIDLQGGQAVQLVQGRKRELAVADVFGLLREFGKYEWLHVIDLDAAMGNGNNRQLMRHLCRTAAKQYGMKVRVGGGIRTVARATEIIRCGAEQVIVGSAAFEGGKANVRFLKSLRELAGRDFIVIALDSMKGQIVINGWRRRLKLQPENVMADFEPYCAGFLCTDVDREGTMSGANLRWFGKLRKATLRPIIAAGGIKSQQEIKALERIGMDAAVGMAVYKKHVR
jgi:phosphoribosylformimino-5-aminoimidazole carboxamide ribotide isomerase